MLRYCDIPYQPHGPPVDHRFATPGAARKDALVDLSSRQVSCLGNLTCLFDVRFIIRPTARGKLQGKSRHVRTICKPFLCTKRRRQASARFKWPQHEIGRSAMRSHGRSANQRILCQQPSRIAALAALLWIQTIVTATAAASCGSLNARGDIGDLEPAVAGGDSALGLYTQRQTQPYSRSDLLIVIPSCEERCVVSTPPCTCGCTKLPLLLQLQFWIVTSSWMSLPEHRTGSNNFGAPHDR